jgi:hypothetical protein
MSGDPYSALIGAGLDLIGGTLQSIPQMVPTAYDKNNKKRLKELQRMSELDALGLTEEEKQVLYNAYEQTAQAGRESLAGQQEAAAQAFSANASGQALKAAQLGQEQQAKTSADIQARITAADQARATALQQELEDRLAYKAQRTQQQVAAVTSLLMPLVSGAKEGAALDRTTSAPEVVTNETAVDATKDLTDDEKAYYDSLYDWS